MSRFISCGVLHNTKGGGFALPPHLRIKNGVFYGNLKVTEDMIKNGKFNFPLKIKEVTGDFDCSFTNLVSLEGAPEKVGGSFFLYSQ